MAIEIPDDWPSQTWVEDTPLAHLETIASDAASGTAVRWEVSSWESTREMASSALPGQVRAKTGLSVGTGKALVKRQPDDFPWKQSLVYELTGQEAQILLAPQGRSEIPTGQFRVADIDGSLTSYGVNVELDERQIDGTDQAPGVLDFPWSSDISQAQINQLGKDPIWLISELAEQMGYSNGPTPTPGKGGYTPILDVPFHGSIVARFPSVTEFNTNDTMAWGTSEGMVGLTGENDSNISIIYETGTMVPQKFVYTMDLTDGAMKFEWNDEVTNGRLGIWLTVDAAGTLYDLQIYSTGSNNGNNATTAVNNIDQDRYWDVAPNRMQVEVTLNVASDTGYNSASVRIARQPEDWSGPYVHAMSNHLSRLNEHNVDIGLLTNSSETGFISNFSLVDANATSAAIINDLGATWGGTQGRIYLETLGGTIISPWLDPDLSVWSTMQHIVEAWQGALITDVYGDLKVLNRFTLAGLNNLQQERVIDVGLKFEDIPWTMNYNDQADRLVVKYRPVVEVKADPNQVGLPIIWELQDVVGVSANSSKDIFLTLEYVYPTDLQILPFIQKPGNSTFHEWDAHRYNNGTGVQITEAQSEFRVDRVTSATWKVWVRNFTASPFHLVDNTGTPWLKLRSSWWYDQTTEQQIERGLSASAAKNPLEIDLSNYVQNEADAIAIADYLWGRVNQRTWRANTITLVPDFQLDLGDVIEIHHARTGIRSNALVTKVKMSGQPGEVGQQIDLVLIPPTWEDFDEEWATAPGGGGGFATWNDFDELWDEYTWNDFDRTPTATTVAQIEEGM